jgi:hypothetical protein
MMLTTILVLALLCYRRQSKPTEYRISEIRRRLRCL